MRMYRAMRETFTVPDEDRFMVVTEHDDDGFFYSKSYLNIERTDDLVILQTHRHQFAQRRSEESAFRPHRRTARAAARSAATGCVHQPP